jgi:hypothetical protein
VAVALAARSSVERRPALRHRGVQTALGSSVRIQRRLIERAARSRQGNVGPGEKSTRALNRVAGRCDGHPSLLDDVPRVKNKFCVDTRAVDGKRASIQF